DKTVEAYLAQLRSALAGQDPALVQDAIYDAEEHLRNALAEATDAPDAFDTIVEAYGTPEEIAASYRESEITVAAALRKPVSAVRSGNPIARFFGVLVDPAAWGALFYMVLSLATGIAYFTIVVTGLSMTAGLAVLIVGIPFALLFLAVVRAVSFVEGRVVEGLLGERMPRRPRTVGQSGGIIDRIKDWLVDSRTWTTMLYMGLQLVLGIIYFTVVVTAVALCASLIALPFVQAATGQPFIMVGGTSYLIETWAFPLFVLAGLLGVIITLWIAKGVGALHGSYAKALLVGRFEQPVSAA
ncbi:MAG: sensor domain-containing protein, partial [Coriobacteriia bacterium]|nr:sensor domain-containing protein [Coriobacteriia bacterium]